ncbi:hypothetical protein EUX98_g2198 [Antrodiella citrinella]|uniref:SMP domain-containing protein n=1 Tax=Antrodiella citrinella TaxID=2447956 RepID=A0A4S4MZL6_9APHY|nr:hypothetical protein EUX98_g2198 [Antrodiella citrinella]
MHKLNLVLTLVAAAAAVSARPLDVPVAAGNNKDVTNQQHTMPPLPHEVMPPAAQRYRRAAHELLSNSVMDGLQQSAPDTHSLSAVPALPAGAAPDTPAAQKDAPAAQKDAAVQKPPPPVRQQPAQGPDEKVVANPSTSSTSSPSSVSPGSSEKVATKPSTTSVSGKPEKAADGSSTATAYKKRALDRYTAGGNAKSGDTGDVDSGNINNIAGPDNTITNMGGNNVPQAGDTISGDATGGAGRGLGPGGNAETGDTGTANGGFVNNSAGVVNNVGPGNNAGDGGVSQTGEATGGTSF